MGRRCCDVYAVYTRKRDVTRRLESILAREGIRVAGLTSDVPPEKREGWFAQRLREGVQVTISHPKIIETGMDLLSHLSLIFFESGYSLHTLRQASRRSWRIELSLRSFHPLEWHSGTVLQHSDHRHGRLLVFRRTRRLRFVGREDLPAGVATQSLHLEHGRFQRRVAHESYQCCRLFLAVHFPAKAFRALVAGMERGVRDGNPVGA